MVFTKDIELIFRKNSTSMAVFVFIGLSEYRRRDQNPFVLSDGLSSNFVKLLFENLIKNQTCSYRDI